MKPNPNSISWSAGKYGRYLGRVDALAKLYAQLETMKALAELPRDELIRLSGEFAALRAPLHAEKCQKLLAERKTRS